MKPHVNRIKVFTGGPLICHIILWLPMAKAFAIGEDPLYVFSIKSSYTLTKMTSTRKIWSNEVLTSEMSFNSMIGDGKIFHCAEEPLFELCMKIIRRPIWNHIKIPTSQTKTPSRSWHSVRTQLYSTAYASADKNPYLRPIGPIHTIHRRYQDTGQAYWLLGTLQYWVSLVQNVQTTRAACCST